VADREAAEKLKGEGKSLPYRQKYCALNVLMWICWDGVEEDVWRGRVKGKQANPGWL